jgi:hypothetical protein
VAAFSVLGGLPFAVLFFANVGTLASAPAGTPLAPFADFDFDFF